MILPLLLIAQVASSSVAAGPCSSIPSHECEDMLFHIAVNATERADAAEIRAAEFQWQAGMTSSIAASVPPSSSSDLPLWFWLSALGSALVAGAAVGYLAGHR